MRHSDEPRHVNELLRNAMSIKYLSLLNGWTVAPHFWRKYIFTPFKCKHYGLDIYTIEVFGFVFFVEVKR